MTEHRPLLAAQEIDVIFPGPRRRLFGPRESIAALSSVSMRILPGETVGLVGESGSGKSTLAKAVLGLVPHSRGTISWDGAATPTSPTRVRDEAARFAQMVFQDPYSSLNPMQTVRDTLTEVLTVRMRLSRAAASHRVADLLDSVHLPTSALDRFPSEFSGGQRQRIVLARALAAQPQLLVCDEPLSALDVTTQARMITLLTELQKEIGMAMLFIGHDLSVVRHLSDRMLVMYHGNVVEEGPADQIYEHPQNPYTQRLVASIPVADPAIQKRRRETRLANRRRESAHDIR